MCSKQEMNKSCKCVKGWCYLNFECLDFKMHATTNWMCNILIGTNLQHILVDCQVPQWLNMIVKGIEIPWNYNKLQLDLHAKALNFSNLLEYGCMFNFGSLV
jgi:hypothetical protein